MTTIAYRNGILAADTRVTIGGSAVGRMIKIARREDGALAFAAGAAGYNHAFLNWFMQGEKEKPPEAKLCDNLIDRGVIVHSEGGMITVFEPDGKFEFSAPYCAIGSGRDIALGVMHHGGSAEQAVEAAIHHDNDTGGSIVVLKHH